MAKTIDEATELREVLRSLRAVVIHRALSAWDRSAETFSDEVVAFNDVDQALRNLRNRR